MTFWGDVARIAFKGKYAAEGALVGLWGLSAGLSLCQVVINTGLQVRRSYKVLALANGAAACVAAASIIGLMQLMGFAGAVAGTAIGQAVEVAIMGVVLWRGLAAGAPLPTSWADAAAQIDIDPV